LRYLSGSPRLPDLNLTLQTSGDIGFINPVNELDVLCNDTIDARPWEYLNVFAQWEKGVGYIFSVGYYAKLLSPRKDDYVLGSIKVLIYYRKQF